MRTIYLPIVLILLIVSSCKKETGCTDPNACNYDATAKVDDGSCIEKRAWYPDENGDGFADNHNAVYSCEEVAGHVPIFSNTGTIGGGGNELHVEHKQRAILPYRGKVTCSACGSSGEPTKEFISENYSLDEAIVLCSSNDAVSEWSDPICSSFGWAFMSAYQLNSIPKMFITAGNIEETFYPNQNNATNWIDQALALEPTVGVAITSKWKTSDSLTVTARSEFFAASNEEHSMSILILEDEVEADQLVGGQGWVEDMPHHHVIRTAAETNRLGESLGSSFSDGDLYTKEFTFYIRPEWDKNELTVVGLVWKGDEINAINGAARHVN